MLGYDETNLYIAAICYDHLPSKNFTIPSLKRDFEFVQSDALVIYLDPFNDKVNGFAFGINPLGVQLEGLLQQGGRFGILKDWDNKWFSEIRQYEDRWVAEIRIPF